MLTDKEKEKAQKIIEEMKASGKEEAEIPDTPLTIIIDGKQDEDFLPIMLIEGFLIGQKMV